MNKMNRRDARRLVDKRCVFCFRENGTTDEHIIPRSIGGELVIKRGTCKSCLKKIELYEGKVLSRHFSSAQALLGIKTQSNKQRRGFKDIRWSADGKSGKESYIHPKEHSGFITQIGFERPGIEVGRHPTMGFGIRFCQILTQIAPGANVPALSTAPFGSEYSIAQFIAKIAHSYWVFMMGHTSLQFSLQDIILNQDHAFAGYLIGGCVEELPQNDLHHICHKTVLVDGHYWGCVDIALFASFGRPALQTRYRAYVGKFITGPCVMRNPSQMRLRNLHNHENS